MVERDGRTAKQSFQLLSGHSLWETKYLQNTKFEGFFFGDIWRNFVSPICQTNFHVFFVSEGPDKVEKTKKLGLVCDLKIRVAPHSRTDRKESVALCDKVAQKCYFLSRTRKLNIISQKHGNGKV